MIRVLTGCLVLALCGLFGSCTGEARPAAPTSTSELLRIERRFDSVTVVASLSEVDLCPESPLVRIMRAGTGYEARRGVADLSIFVNDQPVFVPVAAFADMVDPHRLSVSQSGDQFTLTVEGADAAEAYSVRFFFDSDRVLRREVIDFEDNILESSTFNVVVIE